jgi:hypothetical protein
MKHDFTEVAAERKDLATLHCTEFSELNAAKAVGAITKYL